MRLGNNISANITYTEATKSNTAIKYNIDNTPDDETLERMKYVAENVFEPLREYYGVPIAVTSFYRSKKLNAKVGGSTTSQHIKGEAMDLDSDVYGMITNKQIFDYIRENLQFDQLIWEFGDDKEPAWVHVSSKKYGNRGNVLKAYKEKNVFGKLITKYKNF